MAGDRNEKICKTCFWAYPEQYDHIANQQIRRTDVVWQDEDVSVHDRLKVEPDTFEPVDVSDPDAFFVIAEGDSMVGGNIPPGAHLLVSPSAGVHNGNVVLARSGDDEFTVKTYFRQGGGTTILQPMNPAYEPIVVKPKEPLAVFRVVEIRIKL